MEGGQYIVQSNQFNLLLLLLLFPVLKLDLLLLREGNAKGRRATIGNILCISWVIKSTYLSLYSFKIWKNMG